MLTYRRQNVKQNRNLLMSNKALKLRENSNIFGNDTRSQYFLLKELRAHPVQEMPATTQTCFLPEGLSACT